jgi:hypothetical protein
MAVNVESGSLILADITGYTAYLAGSEIEHAPAIAGDLLETVVGRLEPPFRLAKLEGDAAFVFAEDGRADASLQLDALEAAYVAFRRRLRSIDAATSCDCNACRLAPRLDLKLFVHHGSFVHSRIAGRDELAGSDVILAHRLLKSGPGPGARPKGFALFTAAAVAALGMDPDALDMARSTETIEHIGPVETFVLDLEALWTQESGRRRLAAADERSIHELEAILPVDPQVAWANLTAPALRAMWEGPIAFDDTAPGGRRGVGTTTRCVTGRLASLEEIVDWQPYEHVAWRVAIPGLGPVAATADLEAVPQGTVLRLRWSVPGEASPPEAAMKLLQREKSHALERLLDRLALMGQGEEAQETRA